MAMRRRDWRAAWVVAAVGLGMAGCGEATVAEKSGIETGAADADAAPAADIDGLETPAAMVAGDEEAASERAVRAMIEAACIEAAAYSESFGGRALLVMHRGERIFERYADGWTATRPHLLASGTKSFVGVLAAAAVEDGVIEWEAPASRWIESWREDPRKARITVRQLLDLSSGLDPGEDTLGSGGGGPLRRSLEGRQRGRGDVPRFLQPADKYAASLEVPATSPPGRRFEYGPSHFLAFGAVLTQALNDAADEGRLKERSVEAYLDRRILAPIGLGGAARGWGRDRAGNLNLPGGGRLTARQWARFGEFVRLGGRVPGPDGEMTAVVDESILAACFEASVANPRYGLTWWLPMRLDDVPSEGDGEAAGSRRGEAASGGDSLEARWRRLLLERQVSRSPVTATGGRGGETDLRVWMAAGLGKQRLIIVPDLELVVVRFGRNTQGVQRFEDARVVGTIGEALLAAELGAAKPALLDSEEPEATAGGNGIGGLRGD
jgi:CubicO group peptidase (beta-lactamase class C family)